MTDVTARRQSRGRRCTFADYGAPLEIAVHLQGRCRTFADYGALPRQDIALLGLWRTCKVRHNCGATIAVRHTQFGYQRGTLHHVFKVWLWQIFVAFFWACTIVD